MTCGGMDAGFMGQCSMSWLGLVLAVFVIMIARRWLFEETLQMEFSFIMGIIATVVAYYFSFGIFGAYKIATLIGIVAGLLGGYFGTMIFGGGAESSGNEF